MTKTKIEPDKTAPPGHAEDDPPIQRKLDPREELGLKSPTKKTEDTNEGQKQQVKGQKATQFDGNPNPQGSLSSPFKPEDDTPMKLEKSQGPRDDQ